MVDLNPDMVAMENFDDDEFDQYLPPNGHVLPQHQGAMVGRLGPGPPPPYGAPGTTASTWANSCRLSTSSAGTVLPASGILQRMANNQAGSPSLSPPAATMQSNDSSAAYRTNSDSDSASSPTTHDDTTHAHMSYPREQKFMYDMDHMTRYYQHMQQQQQHQQQQQQQHQQQETAGAGNDENYSVNYGASQQYYGHVMQPSAAAAPPYQCIPSGVKQAYGPHMSAATSINSVQWNKYGRP